VATKIGTNRLPPGKFFGNQQRERRRDETSCMTSVPAVLEKGLVSRVLQVRRTTTYNHIVCMRFVQGFKFLLGGPIWTWWFLWVANHQKLRWNCDCLVCKLVLSQIKHHHFSCQHIRNFHVVFLSRGLHQKATRRLKCMDLVHDPLRNTPLHAVFCAFVRALSVRA
jgi:hypothetical protein